MFTEIHAAIHDLAVVDLDYRGHGLRTVEPRMLHMYPDGKRILYAYQLGGFSRSGLVKGWKSFNIAHVTRLKRTGDRFTAELNFDGPRCITSQWRCAAAENLLDASASGRRRLVKRDETIEIVLRDL